MTYIDLMLAWDMMAGLDSLKLSQCSKQAHFGVNGSEPLSRLILPDPWLIFSKITSSRPFLSFTY